MEGCKVVKDGYYQGLFRHYVSDLWGAWRFEKVDKQ